jgi:DmsE family decaheme c-type cytochrome
MRQRSAALGLLTLIFAVLLPPTALAADADCLECHDGGEAARSFMHEAQAVSCTACHGESQEHIAKPRTPASIVFHKRDMTTNDTCLACHDNAGRMHWSTDGHGAALVACNDCHTLHTTQDAVLTKSTASDVCQTCHRDVRAKFNYPSTHPVNQGAAQCGSCHAAHGSPAAHMLTKATVVDTCTQCHRDKRGPFLFEHDPVTEDCGLCHQPHGSVLPALLTARPQFLCQQCHLAANHPSRLADGSSLSLRDPNVMAGGCVSCHSQIHGSNHPSGARLTR